MTVKVMGMDDVLKCLAKHLIYHPVRPGVYKCNAECDVACTVANDSKYDLCKALRQTIMEYD